jgi:Nucleotidyl transferase AbiEii toxin, Type IV TA system
VSSSDAVFRRIQSVARSAAAKSRTGAPTQEYLIRHTLESFLDRLTRTSHAGDFVLKGGVLLAAYGVRRPTKDADANAVRADVTAEHLAQVVRDIAAVDVDDGVVFDLDTVSVQDPRAGRLPGSSCTGRRVDRTMEGRRGLGRVHRRSDRAAAPAGDHRPDPR